MRGQHILRQTRAVERPPEDPCADGHIPFILDADYDITAQVCMRCTIDMTVTAPSPAPTLKQLDAMTSRVRMQGYLEDQDVKKTPL